MKKATLSISALLLGLVVPAIAMFGGANSGLEKGEATPAFEPTHVSGPDKGTDTCPVCKYGATPAIQVWVNGGNMDQVATLAKHLEARLAKNPNMKAFFVFIDRSKSGTPEKLSRLAEKAGLNKVALTYLSPDNPGVRGYKINLDEKIQNTVLLYRNRQVTEKYVNFVPDKSGLASLDKAIDATLR